MGPFRQMTRLSLVGGAVLLVAGLGASAPAATWHVSPNGNDADPGTAERPFRTIQKAADTVKPGDSVKVAAGIYGEDVVIKTSGAPGQPIVFEGQRDADGAWKTIVDRSKPARGWQPAPEVGPGVFKATLGFNPYSMTLDDKQLARVHDRVVASGKGLALLKTPATALLAEDPEADYSAYMLKEMTFWDGVEALYAHKDGVTYIRFRNGDDPNEKALKAAPAGGGFSLADKGHVVIRRFLVRGAQDSITITGPNANHNVIEENYLANGHNRVVIAGGASHNIVRRNEMTLDYYGHADPGAWGTLPPTKLTSLRVRVYRVFKLIVGPGASDDHGVLMRSGSEGNEVAHNHIFAGLIGVSCGATRKVRVHHNVIHGMSSIGILTSEDAQRAVVDGEFHDNLVYDCNINLRLHHYNNCLPGERREYHYRNRFYLPEGIGSHVYVHWTSRAMAARASHPEMYLYHNTFVGGGQAFSVSGWAADGGGVPGIRLLNNLFSSPMPWRASKEVVGNRTMLGLFDYNWVGGTYYHGVPAWFGEHNVKAEGKTLWPAGKMPDFSLAKDSPARAIGLDLSKPCTLNGQTFGPLPGMTPGYFTGAAPDVGAVQFTEKRE